MNLDAHNMAAHSIDYLVNPRSIAIIGASRDFASISGQPLHHLLTHGFGGKLYPVNPRYEEIAGLRCYKSVDDLPESPDLALLLVAAKRVPDALRQCGEKGIKFAIIYSSGFAESGEEGAECQREITAIAASTGIRIIGPNCQGIISPESKLYAGFGAPFSVAYKKGSLSLISQSGGYGCALVLMADELGLGMRHFVTTGNEAGLSLLDLVDYCIDDPGTSLIATYIEGLKDAHRLVAVATRALDAGKPIFAWKVGNTEAGAKAAASHTANLGGALALYKAAFQQAGVIELSDVADLVDYAKAFAPQRLPRGNRIAVVTISGGAGILMADTCAERGMSLPMLSAASLDALKKIVPTFASLGNPIDLSAGILTQPEIFRQALRIIVDDTEIDGIAIMAAAASGAVALAMANEIAEIYAKTDKPIMLAWNARRSMAAEAFSVIEKSDIPLYETPVRCGRAFAMLSNYASARRKRISRRDDQVLTLHSQSSRDLLSRAEHDLTEHTSQTLLKAYGIGVARSHLATTKAQAMAAGEQIGYPLVIKVQSPDIPHKTEAGAVQINIRDASALASAYDNITASALRYLPDASIEGVLVQEQVADGIEVILGVSNDPAFGPAIMCGLGGIHAEILKDVAFRLLPVTLADAHDMIRELRAFKILDGARGKPKADIGALAEAIVSLSALAMDVNGVLMELDINPLFVLRDGHGVIAGDALAKPFPRPLPTQIGNADSVNLANEDSVVDS